MLDFNSIKLNYTPFQENDGVKLAELPENDIAIIGIALKLPMADTAEEFWSNLRMGIDCIREIPDSRKQDTDNYFRFLGKDPSTVCYSEAAYIEGIDKFDYNFFKISPKEASLLDPNQRLFLQTAWRAIEDAGYGGKKLEGSKTGVYLGFGSDSDYKKMIGEIEPESLSLSMPGNVRPIIASRLSYIMDLKGPSLVVDTTCSSSLVSVHLACQAIRNGECNQAVAGGIQLHLIPVREFEVGVESSTSRTRTFDDSSDGTGTGEGTVAIVLKPLVKAMEDRDPIYAVIKSSAINQDGSSVGITAPNAEAQEEVIVEAWKKAGIDPETIAYMETHGTGTKLGDPIEIEGIQKAFRRFTDKKMFCAISALKSNMGHLDNTAGIAGLLKAIVSLKHKELFPTLHFTRPNRKISFMESPVYIQDKLEKWEAAKGKRRCGVSSFGLSGTNCHVVLEEAPEAIKRSSFSTGKPELFVLSAKTKPVLLNLAQQYIDYLKAHESIDFVDLCYTVSTGRGHYNYRLAMVARNNRELLDRLTGLVLTGMEELNEEPASGISLKELSQSASHTIREYIAAGKQDESVLHEISRQYIKGADIEWERLYKQEKRRRINLPAYPFEEKRCWLEIPEPLPESMGSAAGNLYYTAVWEKEILGSVKDKGLTGNYLVFKDNKGIGDQVIAKLKNEDSEVIEIAFGEPFKKLNDRAYVIEGSMEDYHRLLLEVKGNNISHMIHLFSISDHIENNTLEELNQSLNQGVYSLFYLTKALVGNSMENKLELIIVSNYANDVITGQKRIYPENAALFGLGKVIGWEYKNIRVRCMDIEDSTDPESIIKELKAGANEYKIADRNGQRYVERIDRVDIAAGEERSLSLKMDGVYVITGGMGGLGLHIAKQLASKAKINIAFINRSKLPVQAEWETILNEKTNGKLCRTINAIREIQNLGAEVLCLSADISNEEHMIEAVEALTKRYGSINGVVHAAGIGEGNLLGNLTDEHFRRVMASKVQGTWLLDKLIQPEGIDFFVMFSSAITLVGGVGSGPYTAANSYMDAFAAYRKRKGDKSLVINWPAWENTGLAEGAVIDEEKELFSVLPVQQGVDAFEISLNSNLSQVLVGELNTNSIILQLGDFLPFKFSKAVQQILNPTDLKAGSVGAKKVKIKAAHVKLKGKLNSEYTEIEKKIAQAWRQVLGYEELDVHDNFFEIGGDSILIIKVHSIIDEQFPGKVTLADLFSYYTIAKLSVYLSSSQSSVKLESPDFNNDFQEDIMDLFAQIEDGKLTIDEALSLYRSLEVING